MAKLIVGEMWRNEIEVVKILSLDDDYVKFRWILAKSNDYYGRNNAIDGITSKHFLRRFHTLDKHSRLKRLLNEK